MAGAYVIAIANGAVERAARGTFDHATTGTGGGFDLALTSRAKAVQLLAMAGGHGLRWLSVDPAAAGEVDVALPDQGGGTLALKLAAPWTRETFLGRGGAEKEMKEAHKTCDLEKYLAIEKRTMKD